MVLNVLQVTAQHVNVGLKGHRSVTLHKRAKKNRVSLNVHCHRNHTDFIHDMDLIESCGQTYKENFLSLETLAHHTAG